MHRDLDLETGDLDDVVQQLALENKLERTFAYASLRGLDKALEEGLRCRLTDFFLPDGCVARPLHACETRFRSPTLGKFVRYNINTKQWKALLGT